MKCANRGLFVCLQEGGQGKENGTTRHFWQFHFFLCFAVGDNHKVWIGKKKAIRFCCLYPYLSCNDEKTGWIVLNMALCTSWLHLSILTPYFVKLLTSHSLVSLSIYSVNLESTQIPANNLATKDIQPDVKDGLVVPPVTVSPTLPSNWMTNNHLHSHSHVHIMQSWQWTWHACLWTGWRSQRPTQTQE